MAMNRIIDNIGQGWSVLDDNNNQMPQSFAQQEQQTGFQQEMSKLPYAKYLGDDYKMDNWLADDLASGVKDPIVAMQRYQMLAQPFIDQAKEDELGRSFQLANTTKDPQIKTDALAKIAYYMKHNPDLVNDIAWKHEQQDMARQRFDWEKEKYDFLRDNGFAGVRGIGGSVRGYGGGGGRRGRPPGSGSGRTRVAKFGGLSDEDDGYMDELSDGLLGAKEQNEDGSGYFNNIVNTLSGYYDDMIDSNYSEDQARKQIRKILRSKFRNKLSAQEYNYIISSVAGGGGVKGSQKPSAPTKQEGDSKQSGTSLLDKLRNVFTWDDRAPHGYNENGMYVPEKLHDEYAAGRAKREELRKQGRLNPYTGEDIDVERQKTRDLYSQMIEQAREDEEREEKWGTE